MIARFILRLVVASLCFGAVAATAATAKGPLPVRFGVHQGFERMVFDWPDVVRYRVERQGNLVTLSFDQAAQIDLAALRKGLAHVARDVAATTKDSKLVITFTLTGDSVIVDSRSGPKVVIDFHRDKAEPTPKALVDIQPAAGPATAQAPDRATQGVGPPRSLLLAPEPAQSTIEATPLPSQANPQTASPAPTALPRPPRPRPPMSAARATPPRPASPPVVAPRILTAPLADAAPPQPPVEAAPAREPVGPPVTIRPTPAPPSEPPVVPVDVVRTLDGQGLRFAWADPVGAAVFARGDTLWIVFGRQAQLDPTRLELRRADVVGDFEISNDQTTVMRLWPPGGTAAIARREGNAWLVDLPGSSRSAALALPSNPPRVVVRRGATPAANSLVVEMDGAKSVFRLIDPDAGDTVVVVPTTLPGAGVIDARSHPEMRLLRTAQGIAVLPRTDDVVVQALGTSVEISARRGITISPDEVPASAARAVAAQTGGNTQRLFDLARWQRGGAENFVSNQKDLQNTIVAAPAGRRNVERLEFARFLFANGQAVDSLGVLQLVQQDDPELAAIAPVRALRAASGLMAGDLQTAREINDQTLDGQPEAAFWRGALAVAEGDPRRAAGFFAATSDFSLAYPPPMANRLGLMYAEARIAVGDFPPAQLRLAQIDRSSPTVGEREETEYLRGKILAATVKPDEAIALWRTLETGGYSPSRVSATLARIDLELERKSLTPPQAIEALDRLRYNWRGDRREYAVLQRLGRLQVQIGDLRAGLQTLRHAVTYFPDQRDTKDVVAEMAVAFERFFVAGQALTIAPIVAVGVFEEFRELTPPGPRGDAIMNRLVDHMMAMDLLDRAGDLLDHLVKHRYTGADKAAAGAKLALVRLLDRNPDAALQAIEMSAASEASPELQSERARLAARALSDLDRPAEALQRIVTDESEAANLLRVEIQWRAKDWAQAATALEKLSGSPPTTKDQLPEEQARRVIRLATALALAGDDAGLQRLKAQFGPALDRGPYKAVFATVTSTSGAALTAMDEIATRIAAATPMQSFLASYRAKVVAPKG